MPTQYKLEAKLAGNYIKANFYLKKLNKEFILINFCLILVENFKYKLWSQYRTCPQHLFLAAMADMPLKINKKLSTSISFIHLYFTF